MELEALLDAACFPKPGSERFEIAAHRAEPGPARTVVLIGRPLRRGLDGGCHLDQRLLPSGTSRLVKQTQGRSVGVCTPGFLLVDVLPEFYPRQVLGKSRGLRGRLEETAVFDVL